MNVTMMTVRVQDMVRVATMLAVENQIDDLESIDPVVKSADMDDQAKVIHHVVAHDHAHTPGIDDEMGHTDNK